MIMNTPESFAPHDPAELLGYRVDTPVATLLGRLASRIELPSEYLGTTLSLEERYAGYLLATTLRQEASVGQYLPDEAAQDAWYVVSHRFGGELDTAQAEGITDLVVAANVAAMESRAMQEVLSMESVGGNAGCVKIGDKKYPAAGVNGFADGNSGLITAFGNFQYIDADIKARSREFTLRIARGWIDFSDKNAPKYASEGRIVNVYRRGDFYDEAKGTESDLTDRAVDVIRQSARYYNERYVKKYGRG